MDFPFEVGKKYYVCYKLPSQRLAHAMVGVYVGVSQIDDTELEFSLPELGNGTLPKNCIRSARLSDEVAGLKKNP